MKIKFDLEARAQMNFSQAVNVREEIGSMSANMLYEEYSKLGNMPQYIDINSGYPQVVSKYLYKSIASRLSLIPET